MRFQPMAAMVTAVLFLAGGWAPAEAASLTTFVRGAQCYEQKASNQGPLVGSCAAHLNGDLATSAFDARADFGSVGARGIAGTARINNAIAGRASAYFDDQLSVSQLSGTMTFAIDLAGSFSEQVPNQFAVNGGAFYAVTAYFAGNSIFNRYRSYDNQGRLVEQEDSGSLGISYHTLQIVNGQVNLSAAITADAQCLYGVCTLGSDLFNSARFVGAQVFDENGVLIENAQVSSSSGFDYLKGLDPHVPQVPLPAGLFMLVSGLGMLRVFRNRVDQAG